MSALRAIRSHGWASRSSRRSGCRSTAGAPTRWRPPEPSQKSWRDLMRPWSKIAAGTVLVAALGAAGYWLLWPREAQEAEAPLATPPGVTLQNMTFQQPAPFVILSVIKGPFRFADGKG